jgi:hypothetical protein
MQRQTRRTANRRAAQTLLELVAATTIIAIAVVPALRLMRESVRVGRESETANLMATLSASLLEEHLLRIAVSWTPSTVSGDYSALGYPNIRFQVIRSDSSADGGITNSLMSITSTVWDDRDNDGNWDAGEPRSTFASKLARNVAYQQEASGA